MKMDVVNRDETVTTQAQTERRERVLSVLARAAEDSEFLARLADDPTAALAEYYTLTREEVAALVSGDVRKVEGWLGKLDPKHATWLWLRLGQEKW